MAYFIESTALFSTLFAIYYLFLKDLKFLKTNRFLLITMMLSALLLPLLGNVFSIEFTWGSFLQQSYYDQITQVESIPILGKSKTSDNVSSLGVPRTIFFGFYLYLAVSIVLIISVLSQLFSFFLLMKKSSISYELNGIKHVITNEVDTPFSFFNAVFLPSTLEDPVLEEQVLLHESCHVREGHSFDIILAELFRAIFWINPLVWINNKEVRCNLEYLADEAVLETGVSPKVYQMNILALSAKLPRLALVNAFNQDFIKKRILKMKQKETKSSYKWTYLYILPILSLFLVSFDFSPASKLVEKIDLSEYYAFEGGNAYLLLTNDLRKSDTQKLEKIFLDKGIELSFAESIYGLNGKIFQIKFTMIGQRSILSNDQSLLSRIPTLCYLKADGSAGIGVFSKDKMNDFPPRMRDKFESKLPTYMKWVRDYFPSIF